MHAIFSIAALPLHAAVFGSALYKKHTTLENNQQNHT
jgi:hypothetical protein